MVMTSSLPEGSYTYNGMDRVDNAKGYVLGNVVPCCHTCNFAKRGMATNEFVAWVTLVSNHLNLTSHS